MDNTTSTITPEALASLTREFSTSDFGKEFVKIMNEQIDGYKQLAQKFTTPAELKLAANERAAAIGELIQFIDMYCKYADNPEMLEGAIKEESIDN